MSTQAQITEMVYSLSEQIEWNCATAIALCRRVLDGNADPVLLNELDSAVIDIEGADYLNASDIDFNLPRNLGAQDKIRFVTGLLTEVNLHRLCTRWTSSI